MEILCGCCNYQIQKMKNYYEETEKSNLLEDIEKNTLGNKKTAKYIITLYVVTIVLVPVFFPLYLTMIMDIETDDTAYLLGEHCTKRIFITTICFSNWS